MAIIYKIYNDINNKLYIGKTEKSIEKRFQEHCIDAFKKRCEKRPLYTAICKYGTQHFFIEEIEQTNNPEEREIYWINYYNTYKNGYNATKGGDGKSYIDYDLILKLWEEGKNINTIYDITGYSKKSIRNYLKKLDNFEQDKQKRFMDNKAFQIMMLDKNTDEFIKNFISMNEAEKFLNKVGAHRHIAEVCYGQRKTAYGYKWKFCETSKN